METAFEQERGRKAEENCGGEVEMKSAGKHAVRCSPALDG